jgi:hypothetical protein
MSEVWLTKAEAAELFRSLRPMSVGKSEADARRAWDSDEVRPEPTTNTVLLLADDGIVGMDLRPGQNKGRVNASGQALAHTRTVGDRLTDDRRRSKADLLYWFDQQDPSSPTPTRHFREQADRDAAKRVINSLYPRLPGVRELPYKVLHGEVSDRLKANGEKPVHYDTVRRAAKEIRAEAAKAPNAPNVLR